MKIAFYCTGNIWQAGGGATVIKNLLLEASCFKDIQKVLYVSNYIDIPPELNDHFDIVKLKTPKSRLLLELYDQVIAPFILLSSKFERVICLNSIVPLLYPRRIDVYFQMRMFYFEELDSTSKKMKNLLGKLSMQKSTSIYVASKDHKKDLLQHLNLEGRKIKVVYLSVDHEKLNGYRIENSRNSDKLVNPYFLFVSVIRPYKNLHSLIKAYIQLFNEVGDDLPELRIIGSPSNYVGMTEYMDDIHLQINDAKIHEKIVFLGTKPHSETMTQLLQSKALVFPTFFEGFGLPLLEAMACGVPVIVSNRNSLPEIGGNFVKYIDPDSVEDIKNKLFEIISYGYDEKMVNDALERAQRFTWKESANAIIEDKEYIV
jgi:glycosyltransferase involved in cell wall biosynthesis